jgi:transcriptional regulator
MYLPEAFREEDSTRLEALVRRHSFGTLVSVQGGQPFASHLPLLLDTGLQRHGKLLGHMARSNPQWQSLAQGQRVLAIFQGPHAYVSPSWYRTPGVPTWNYAVVHVYGTARLIENPEALVELVTRLTAISEGDSAAAWTPDLSSEMQQRMLRMIVGFEVDIQEVQGKFKLNQNRSTEDQRRVIQRLRQRGSAGGIAVADLMADNLEPK